MEGLVEGELEALLEGLDETEELGLGELDGEEETDVDGDVLLLLDGLELGEEETELEGDVLGEEDGLVDADEDGELETDVDGLELAEGASARPNIRLMITFPSERPRRAISRSRNDLLRS